MIRDLRHSTSSVQVWTWLLIAMVLLGAAFFGQRASVTWLGVLVVGVGTVILLQTPRLGLLVIVAAALLVPLEFGTGTEVNLNAVTLLVPAMLVLGVLDMMRRREIRLVSSRVNLPLVLFLLAGLFSLFFGVITWDPAVPRSNNFLLVQLAQWGIFVLSAGAFWLTANLLSDERWLRRLTWTFLLVAGGVAILRIMPGVGGATNRLTSIAFTRAPLWVLLFGLAGGQLIFNHQLTNGLRIFLLAVLVAVIIYAFIEQQEAVSNWVGIVATLGLLLWLRFPRLRWLILVALVGLAALGVLFPTIYNFAGGDAEWRTSGGSRLVLSARVIDVTMRNPITGLGPAAYRLYAAMTPLRYGGGNWIVPQINSHNNYVDIFSHVGIVGMALFLWFVAEIALLGRRLHNRYRTGFASGYVNGMMATLAGILVIMLLLDWFLPFVYNVGFPGFQASVLVWLFLGGLVAIDNWRGDEKSDEGQSASDLALQKGNKHYG